ncbi:peptide/nickel transport system ATP-binding protein [Thermotomaculum hydrothermale]|uniref:Peptide/nickel transport system ATP-binding protein n=1 Tax=Thermotomaculum hydrothermale TaxID=981385 RepID=A0A7R6PM50_9BACT|nr:ABC transporter ATP-binding protein [Thermotomaculum hydrothermale]BBB32093.1 peptide/nickel transport system ATP-binding protein [Thermotomaculum hydrothermale]
MCLLKVSNLKVVYPQTIAVRDVSFSLKKGEKLGLVGESGCGKSVLSLSLLNIILGNGKVVNGKIEFKGNNIFHLSKERLRQLRGRGLGYVFQEPQSAFDPVFTVGNQVAETLISHGIVKSKKEAKQLAVKYFDLVKIENPEFVYNSYPFQLSGGMAQRIYIALILMLNPEIVIADEPTTALDVITQKEILKLIKNIVEENNLSLIFITHNLLLLKNLVDRIIVMYAGTIMEDGDFNSVFNNPLHPYTEGLLKSITINKGKKQYLDTIPGNVPHRVVEEDKCPFADRCLKKVGICTKRYPELKEIEGRKVRCHLY